MARAKLWQAHFGKIYTPIIRDGQEAGVNMAAMPFVDFLSTADTLLIPSARVEQRRVGRVTQQKQFCRAALSRLYMRPSGLVPGRFLLASFQQTPCPVKVGTVWMRYIGQVPFLNKGRGRVWATSRCLPNSGDIR